MWHWWITSANGLSNGQSVQQLFSCFQAVLTPLIAILALSTWRRQLSGEARYSSATRLLNLANRVRDHILAERLNPAPLTWFPGIPEQTPENIQIVENKLASEREYLYKLSGYAATLTEEMNETVPSIDGILPIDVKATAHDPGNCLTRWSNAIQIRLRLIENCSAIRRYEDLEGIATLNPILVRDDLRPESIEFEEEIRRAAIQVAEDLKRFVR